MVIDTRNIFISIVLIKAKYGDFINILGDLR